MAESGRRQTIHLTIRLAAAFFSAVVYNTLPFTALLRRAIVPRTIVSVSDLKSVFPSLRCHGGFSAQAAGSRFPVQAASRPQILRPDFDSRSAAFHLFHLIAPRTVVSAFGFRLGVSFSLFLQA